MSNISTPYYKALDFAGVFLSCSIAYWVRFDTLSLPLYYFLPTAIFAITSTFTLSITEFYQTTNSTYSHRQVIACALGLIFAAILTIACLYLTKTGEDYSRIWLTTSVLFSLITLLTTRLILSNVFRASTPPKMVALLGNGATPNFIVKTLASENISNIVVAKHFKVEGTCNKHLTEVADFIEQHRTNLSNESPITEVWVTISVFSTFNQNQLNSELGDSATKVVYIPEIPTDYLTLNGEKRIQILSGIPIIYSEDSKRQKLGQLLKLLEDQIIAWITLILLSPLLLLIAASIKLESSGPIIFKQLRYGLGGKEFLIWKFRTMYKAESSADFKQAQKDDPRITKIGRFLRRTSLDELPQLLNVINGSMSIVGPRPHPVKLNEQYRQEISQYMYRHASKPGITGLAQVKGFRGETVDPDLMAQRVRYDLEYIRNWSIFLDIKILLMTFVHLFTTNKAY